MPPTTLPPIWDAGIERVDFARTAATPSSMTWARFPYALRREQLTGGAEAKLGGDLPHALRRERLGGDADAKPGGDAPDDPALRACALAYRSDLNAMDAIVACTRALDHAEAPGDPGPWRLLW